MTKRLPPEVKQARKPIHRACVFCHSKHLQCDASRPCKNCMKRGVANTCHDLERKSNGRVTKPGPRRRSARSSTEDVSLDESSTDSKYGDQAAGFIQPNGQHLFYMKDQGDNMINTAVQKLSLTTTDGESSFESTPQNPFQSTLAKDEYLQLTDILTTNPPSPSEYFGFDISTRPFIQVGEDGSMISSYPNNGTPNSYSFNPEHSQMPNTASKVPSEIQEEEGYTSPLILRHIIKVPDDIYLTTVVKSYQYPKAYHSLIQYLKERFNRDQLLEIAKCMAKYRPSFISATKSLYENDLIFTERSFQRSLLEYESLISVSPSPTIIWRRTGEIVALTNEFAVMTGYSKMSLLSKRTFIVELMDDESTIKYFKSFSSMAFGDLNATLLTDCVLRKAHDNDYLRCACVWTIKRDVFDIPMLIVGQFLPVLD